ncbi:hypothetical protein AJ79_04130 [Helicocarpus griseus UAMH5409]|uniref:Glycan binding protein Y3-like domain-containing protein n=1 Tax=Helicocarpus griseus UAMH5409 TaxID=1447875 RepID=A0A2B7XVH9_9EURO|nr:hypothetical protein AJ79_04130 [Helicocarpus griseus UAMH5409]
MRLNASAILAGLLAFSPLVSAELVCYDGGGTWGAEPWVIEALTLIDGWCESLGRRFFPPNHQEKRCYDAQNGKAKVQLRMKNGRSSDQILEPSTCKTLLQEIVHRCDRGGRDDTTDGWRPRADPGSGCD